MGTPGSQVIIWIAGILGLLIILPLIGMFVMPGSMMGGPMAPAMGAMMGWGLLWTLLAAVVLIALIVFLVRTSSRT